MHCIYNIFVVICICANCTIEHFRLDLEIKRNLIQLFLLNRKKNLSYCMWTSSQYHIIDNIKFQKFLSWFQFEYFFVCVKIKSIYFSALYTSHVNALKIGWLHFLLNITSKQDDFYRRFFALVFAFSVSILYPLWLQFLNYKLFFFFKFINFFCSKIVICIIENFE